MLRCAENTTEGWVMGSVISIYLILKNMLQLEHYYYFNPLTHCTFNVAHLTGEL
jgi:hypothetical protein